jgi:hypothetical protein
LSKTKHFVVIEIIGKQSKEQAVKEELLQESSVEAASAVSESEKRKKVESEE